MGWMILAIVAELVVIAVLAMRIKADAANAKADVRGASVSGYANGFADGYTEGREAGYQRLAWDDEIIETVDEIVMNENIDR